MDHIVLIFRYCIRFWETLKEMLIQTFRRLMSRVKVSEQRFLQEIMWTSE